MHFRISGSGRWLAPVLMLLSACELFSPTAPPPEPATIPKFESFGMTQRSYQVRPYTCGRATLRMVADRKIERDDIVWSADTKLVDLEDVSYSSGNATLDTYETFSLVDVCAREKHGKLKVRAGLKSQPDYFAEGELEIGLPASGQANPVPAQIVLGHPHSAPTRVFWSKDGASVFVASKDRTLTKWNGTTLALEGGWVTMGDDASLIEDGRVFVPIYNFRSAIFDLPTARYTTWFDGLGQAALFSAGVLQPAGSSEARSISANAGRLAAWASNDGQNTQGCGIQTLDLKTNKRLLVDAHPSGGRARELNFSGGSGGAPPPTVRPEWYTEVSSKGRYVAFGPTGCSVGNSVYDTQNDRFAVCGTTTLRTKVHRVGFSEDESTLVVGEVPDTRRIELYKMPDCRKLGNGRFDNTTLMGWALSPDGNTLAVVGYNGAPRLLLYDVAEGSPLWKPADYFRANFTEGDVTRDFVLDFETGGNSSFEPGFYRLAFSPDGKRIVVASTNGRLARVDLEKADGGIRYDEQPMDSENPYETRLAPGGRYLWLKSVGTTSDIHRGLYDLQERRMVVWYDANTEVLMTMEPDAFVVRRGTRLFRVPYATPSQETEVFGVAPTQGEDASLSPSGRYQCVVSGTQACRKDLQGGGEQCVQLEQASGGVLKTAQSAAMLNDNECLLGDAPASRLWRWPTGTQTVTLQTHLVSSDANDIIRFERLDARSLLIVTRRLFVWKAP
ncbi:WD40 repeat domain-containing protein [Archangium sp.]|uniref:WD40 repeat domain-containing protein n=1 Tax=Archangium sp. TaxID=1872627 RepID=UPI00286B063D|nr:WD40 repeat domain-containing protein [Archangium sp.]